VTPKQKLITKVGAASAALLLSMVPVFEGYRPSVYKDPIGRLAVCYGHDDQSMKMGTTYTRQQCEDMLADDLLKHADALACINRPLSDGQKAAFVSFAFNVGNKAFCGSTLARKANAGDMTGACAELSRWTLAGGKQLPGLVNRRQIERKVCES